MSHVHLHPLLSLSQLFVGAAGNKLKVKATLLTEVEVGSHGPLWTVESPWWLVRPEGVSDSRESSAVRFASLFV